MEHTVNEYQRTFLTLHATSSQSGNWGIPCRPPMSWQQLNLVAGLVLGWLLLTGCQAGPGAATGGALGTLTGGLAGAAIGASEGKGPEGALIGALAGGTLGSVAGHAVDRSVEQDRLNYLHQQQDQRGNAVNFEQIIRMTQSGLGSEVIARQIHNQGILRRPTIDELIYLQNSGVDNIVIQAIQNAPIAGNIVAPARERVIYHSYGADPCFGPHPFYYHDYYWHCRPRGPRTELRLGF